MKRHSLLFCALIALMVAPPVLAGNITRVEYFLDDDPGYGQGTSVPVTPGAELQLNIVLNLAGVSEGMHQLYVRAVDDEGVWGVPVVRPLLVAGDAAPTPDNLADGEYFFDTDPGYGNGTPFTVADDTTDEIQTSIDVSSLAYGRHTLYYRQCDVEGLWGLSLIHHFIVEPRLYTDLLPSITFVEYIVSQEEYSSGRTMESLSAADTVVEVQFYATIDDPTLYEDYILNASARDQYGAPAIPFIHTFQYMEMNTEPERIGPIADCSLPEDFETFALADLDTVFNDVDIPFGDSLRFTFQTLHNLFTPVLDDTMLLLESVQDVYGVDTLLITATDDSSASVSDTVQVTIQPVNDPPGPFARLTPADNATVQVDTVQVTWSTSVDIDSETPVSYRVQWSDDEGFHLYAEEVVAETCYVITEFGDELMSHAALKQMPNTPDHRVTFENPTRAGRQSSDRYAPSRRESPETALVSSFPLEVSNLNAVSSPELSEENTRNLDALEDNQTFYWRVVVLDDSGAATWANGSEAGWSFHIDQPDTPLPFALAGPVSDTVITEDRIALCWCCTSDPDAYDVVQYEVWLDTLAEFSTAFCCLDSLPDTAGVVGELLDDHTYFWTVRATDSNTDGTWAEDTLVFHTAIPEAPLPFSLVFPDSGAGIPSQDQFPLIFRWATAVDPDPDDEIAYTFEISADETFTDPVSRNAGGLTSLVVDSLQQGIWWWRVFARDLTDSLTVSLQTWSLDVTLGVGEFGDGLPDQYAIESVYPNPFNPVVSVRVGLPEAARLTVGVYNVLGREVEILDDAVKPAGYHTLHWNGAQCASGIYFIRAFVPGRLEEFRKIVLLK